jgi:small subunit ribosomal protein S23
MVRRIASQVHKQASRLTRAGFLKTPPVWYEAVLEHPPLPLPPREPPARTSYDSTPQKQAFALKETPGPRVLPVKYIEDDIRRQFFRDHPFEAFRARSITEAGAVEDEHPIRGLQWTRLNQRGRNPSPEEYVKKAFLSSRHLLTSAFPRQQPHLLANPPAHCSQHKQILQNVTFI